VSQFGPSNPFRCLSPLFTLPLLLLLTDTGNAREAVEDDWSTCGKLPVCYSAYYYWFYYYCSGPWLWFIIYLFCLISPNQYFLFHLIFPASDGSRSVALLDHLNQLNQIIRRKIHCLEFESPESKQTQAGGTGWSKVKCNENLNKTFTGENSLRLLNG